MSSIETFLINYMKNYLLDDMIDLDLSFLAIGGDSILAKKLSTDINTRFALDIKVEDFYHQLTLRDICSRITDSLPK